MYPNSSFHEMYFPEDFEQFYPEVVVNALYNFDGELEGIDLVIDNLHDSMHSVVFEAGKPQEKREVLDKRFRARRRKALKELTAGIYNEKGNPIKKRTK